MRNGILFHTIKNMKKISATANTEKHKLSENINMTVSDILIECRRQFKRNIKAGTIE